MVADIEELEEMNASELHARSLNSKEVLTPKKGEQFIFPIADGTVKTSGGDQQLRTSTLLPDSPDRGEEQDNLRGESERSSLTSRQDSSWYDGEAKSDFGLSQEISFTVITWNSESNCTCRLNNSFPIALKYIDVTRTTDTTLDVMLDKILTITGMLMDIVNCQIRGLVSPDGHT